MTKLDNKLNIIQDYKIAIEMTDNPYDFAITDLFKMATRINKKRQFLFVSTVLGKHLAVQPQVPILTGALLAMMYYERLTGKEPLLVQSVVQAMQNRDNVQEILQQVEELGLELAEDVLFIGFAETATALGHAVFNVFKSNATYIHTTRELVPELEPFVTFEEEHSHATSHRVYCEQPEKLLQAKQIVLIDDEITTGNTVVNIIETLQRKFPHVQRYSVLSILDWRSSKQRAMFAQLEAQWGITIDFVAIMSGHFTCEGTPLLTSNQVAATLPQTADIALLSVDEVVEQKQYHSIAENGVINRAPYMLATGRFTITAEQHVAQKKTLQAIAAQLRALRTGGPALVIGTGEFMYVPMQIATGLGQEVYFQSTTRSPIYCADDPSYTITDKIAFESPENNGVENYLYNLHSHPYSELFLVIERIANQEVVAKTVQALKAVSNANIYVFCMHDWRTI